MAGCCWRTARRIASAGSRWGFRLWCRLRGGALGRGRRSRRRASWGICVVVMPDEVEDQYQLSMYVCTMYIYMFMCLCVLCQEERKEGKGRKKKKRKEKERKRKKRKKKEEKGEKGKLGD